MRNMKLNPFIYYRIYLDKLYMYDTKNKKAYQFNESAADMIDIIGNNPGLVYSDFIRHCMEMYDAPQELIENDANDFIKMLMTRDILVNPEIDSKINTSFKQRIADTSDETDKDVEELMYTTVGEHKILSKALLELTYRCNLKCVHCYAIGSGDARQEMDTNKWFDILDQLSDANVLSIVFTGGEVFVRDDFFEIFDYAINKRFLVDIYSNGTKITDEQIGYIAGRYINSFQTSIYGDTPELHDSITGVKGSFDKTLNTMRKFKEYGVSLTIKTIMMKQNADSCSGMREIANDLGAEFQIGLSISKTNNGANTPTAFRVKSPEQMKSLLLERDRELLNQRPEPKDLDKSLCGAGFNGISITPSGKVLICNAIDLPIGDCKLEKIIDVWNESDELKSFRQKRISNISKCACCKYLDYCQFCPGVALQDAGSITEAYDEACFIAKMRYEALKQHI